MKKTLKYSIFCLAAVLMCFGIYLMNKKNTAETVSNSVSEITAAQETTTEPSQTSPVEEATITQAPTTPPKIEINLMMVGDMLIHDSIYKTALRSDGTYNFDHLFQNILPDIAENDIRIVNQETILGGDGLGFSGYPAFNSPAALGHAEAKAGFNVILHATNHTLDKGQKGVLNCLNFWNTNYPDIAVLGINQTQEDYENIYIYEKEDFKVAILNYTYGTNGIKLPSSMPYIVNLLEEDKIRTDVAAAKELADMVVVCPHWGTEYVHKPDYSQKRWTDLFLELGADVVIGTHPHVIEPVEVLTSDNGHSMLVYYSLGNFVSCQDEMPRMIGGMAEVTLVKDNTDCYIKSYKYTPIITHKLFTQSSITSYKLADYSEELAYSNRIKSDENCEAFSYSYCKQLCRQVLGSAFDYNTGYLYVELHE